MAVHVLSGFLTDGTLPTALAVRNLKLGVAALTILVCVWAAAPAHGELPDAPSTVLNRQQGTRQARSGRISEQPAWMTPDRHLLAMNFAPPVDPQESLYRPQNQKAAPGFSSSIGANRPIPGEAPSLHNACPTNSCSLAQTFMCCGSAPPAFSQYLKSRDAVPLTARDNLNSAVKNLIDPFNIMTILADSAIGVGTDSHSVYGPGMRGFAKYTGVSVTEDLTGEFFGTFLVPSLTHQDPHYHRQPFASIPRRLLHTVTQVFWAQSYTGRPMPNYANIVGGIATAVVSNTFVPGPGRQGFSNTSQRLAIAFATSPSGNMIEEFVPDIASRINLRVVIFQRILNSVAIEEGGTAP